MGLTGVIASARLQLAPITTSTRKVRPKRYDDLDAIFAAMDTPERYCVAWLAALGGASGRAP